MLYKSRHFLWNNSIQKFGRRIRTNNICRNCHYYSTTTTTTTVPLSHVIYTDKETNPKLPPVLMTHGLLGSKQNWNSIGKAIVRSTQRKVVIFDARNHGDSPHSETMNYDVMIDDVLGLVESLEIKKSFILLGHSMGGRMASAFALKYPKLLSKLIVVDISPLNLGGDFDLMRSYLEAMNSMKFEPGLTLSEARKYADNQLQEVVPETSVRTFLLTNLTRNSETNSIYWKPNLPVLLSSLNEIKTFPTELLQRSSGVQSLFIRGELSKYVPESDYSGIQKLFPHVKFITIKNAGHWPQAENPAPFVEALSLFLRKV